MDVPIGNRQTMHRYSTNRFLDFEDLFVSNQDLMPFAKQTEDWLHHCSMRLHALPADIKLMVLPTDL